MPKSQARKQREQAAVRAHKKQLQEQARFETQFEWLAYRKGLLTTKQMDCISTTTGLFRDITNIIGCYAPMDWCLAIATRGNFKSSWLALHRLEPFTYSFAVQCFMCKLAYPKENFGLFTPSYGLIVCKQCYNI